MPTENIQRKEIASSTKEVAAKIKDARNVKEVFKSIKNTEVEKNLHKGALNVMNVLVQGTPEGKEVMSKAKNTSLGESLDAIGELVATKYPNKYKVAPNKLNIQVLRKDVLNMVTKEAMKNASPNIKNIIPEFSKKINQLNMENLKDKED